VSEAALARLRELFLDPDGRAVAARPAVQVAERAVPATLGLLAAPADAAAAGAALGLAAAAGRRAPCVLVCRWTGERTGASASAASRPAVGAARRLATRLASRGLVADARGRLVTVLLPPAEAEARAAAERAVAAAGETPTVLVVAGPRPAVFDALLAELDRLVVIAPPDAPAGLEQLAVDAAARLGRGTGVLRLPRSAVMARRIAVSCGLLVSPALRAAADAALRGHDGA
jgi:hypothetical protein